MDQKAKPQDEPVVPADDETAKKDHPAPHDALARDDLPEAERIEQQNDVA